MSKLDERLTSDIAEAMRSGDKRRRDVIRYLRAAVKNAEIERQRPLTDDEIEDVIRFQVKQRRDSIELFRKGGRDDLADEELAQLAILLQYLPAQLSDDALRDIVHRIIGQLGASSLKDMSRVMPAVMAEVGPRAEGRRVSEMVKNELATNSAHTTPSAS